MTIQRRRIALLALGAALLGRRALAAGLDAPNPVEVSPLLTTSGQPTPRALDGLATLGYQAVIYLAPDTVPDAVKDEGERLRRQGIAFIHLPIPFNAPTEAHVMAVSEALLRLQDQRVLVHCQVNLRASTVVFLHRVITLKDDPARAYEAVSAVWSPEGPWHTLIVDMLRQHRIAFRPL